MATATTTTPARSKLRRRAALSSAGFDRSATVANARASALSAIRAHREAIRWGDPAIEALPNDMDSDLELDAIVAIVNRAEDAAIASVRAYAKLSGQESGPLFVIDDEGNLYVEVERPDDAAYETGWHMPFVAVQLGKAVGR